MVTLISFLQQLCAIPEIANSEEMQEFLALNTDARIAFVKKPFITSRIDKVLFLLLYLMHNVVFHNKPNVTKPLCVCVCRLW